MQILIKYTRKIRKNYSNIKVEVEKLTPSRAKRRWGYDRDGGAEKSADEQRVGVVREMGKVAETMKEWRRQGK